MTSKLQRLIDLETEAQLNAGILNSKMSLERDNLRKEIEEKLGVEYTKHV